MSNFAVPPVGGNDNRGPTILAVTWTEATIATIIVGVRIYTRTKVIRSFGSDDFFMILTLMCALACTTIDTYAVHLGVGRHMYFLQRAMRIEAVKYNWLAQPFMFGASCFGKISIVLFLLRVMGKAKAKIYREFLYVLTVLQIATNIVAVVMIFAQCKPVTALWDPIARKDGKCWPPYIIQHWGFFRGAFNSFTDLALALFPITIIWNLQMQTRIRVILCCIMGMGVFATATAIVKTVFVKELGQPDVTWVMFDLIIWFQTENYTIIVAACIPTLKPLFSTFFKKSSNHTYEIGSYERHKDSKGFMGHSHGKSFDSTAPTAINEHKGIVMARSISNDEEISTNGKFGDTSSEEIILPNPDQIKKTTDIVIHYDNNNESAPAANAQHHTQSQYFMPFEERTAADDRV